MGCICIPLHPTNDATDWHPMVLPISDFLHPIFLEHGQLTPSDYDYDYNDDNRE